MAYQTGDDLTQIISLLSSLSDQQYRKETREKSNVNDVFQNINNAMKIVNNVEGLTNMQNSLHNIQDSANKYGETAISYGVMDEALKSKKAQIGLFNSAVDQANDMINGTTFLEQTTDFTALTNPDSDIYSMIMGEKNADGTQRFASIIDWVSQEYGKTDNLQRKLKQGIDAGYNYNKKNISDGDAFNKIESYKKRLDVAMQALLGDEVITPDEASHIIIGDKESYNTVKTNKLTKIGAGIEEYDSMIKYLDKILAGGTSYSQAVKDSMNEEDKNSFLQANLMNELGLLDDEDKEAKIEKFNEVGLDFNSISLRQDILDAQDSYEQSRNKLIDNYKMWDGYDYQGAFSKKNILGDDGGFGDFANEDSPEIIDLDGDDLPDTNEFGMTLEQQQEYNQDLQNTYGTTDIETIKGYLSGDLKRPPTKTLMLSSDKSKLDTSKIEEMGGEEILTQFIKGDISEADMESFLNELQDFDMGTLHIQGPFGVYKYFNPANYFGKGINDILSLKDMRRNYKTVLSMIPGIGVPIGEGKELLEMKDTDDETVKEYKEKVKYISEILNEWINIEDSNAGDALKNLLNGSINITEALNQASQDVPPNIMLQTRTDVFGSKKREQLMNFIKNYKEQNKLSLQEYVDKNKSKFNTVARILKYGKTFRKTHK